MCFLRTHFLILQTGTTIILPKRPPKSTEDKEETIQKLEVRGKCNRQLASGSLRASLLPSFCECEFLFLFILT